MDQQALPVFRTGAGVLRFTEGRCSPLRGEGAYPMPFSTNSALLLILLRTRGWRTGRSLDWLFFAL